MSLRKKTQSYVICNNIKHNYRKWKQTLISNYSNCQKETEIPSLVEDINLTGVNSGLKFKNIRLENEVKQEFSLSSPLVLKLRGLSCFWCIYGRYCRPTTYCDCMILRLKQNKILRKNLIFQSLIIR